MNSLLITDLGLISYTDACALQQRLVAARKVDAIEDVLLFCEHPHVITLGRNANRANLLVSENVLRQKNVELHSTNRGGDITYHGPGQIVGYPILHLDKVKRDVGWYVRTLEEAMIRASADFGVTAYRVPGKTGIWVEAVPTEEKLAAIGVHISRWVTSHGFAYNVSTDLRYFQLIVPCGIAERSATSLEKLLGRAVAIADVAAPIARHLGEVLQLDMHSVARVQFLEDLARAEAQAEQSPPSPAIPVKAPVQALETVRSNA